MTVRAAAGAGEQHVDGSICPLLSTGKRAALFADRITERYGHIYGTET